MVLEAGGALGGGYYLGGGGVSCFFLFTFGYNLVGLSSHDIDV